MAALAIVGTGCARAGGKVRDSGPPIVKEEPDAGPRDAGEPKRDPKPVSKPDAAAPKPPPPPEKDAGLDGFVPHDAFCEGKGPVIRLPDPDGDEICTTTLARETFTSALCTCEGAVFGGALNTSSFSFLSPGTLDQGGASVGINGDLVATGVMEVGGSLRLGGGNELPLAAVAGFVNVWGDLEVQQHLEFFGALTVAGDARLGGGASYLPTWTGVIAGDAITQTGLAGPSPIVAVLGERREEDLQLTPPCACEEPDLLPVDDLVQDAQLYNDNMNPDATLKASDFSGLSGDQRIDLPCGRFYLDEITGEGSLELHVDGRTALFVGGDVSVLGGFNLVLGPEGELDVFISGNLTQVGVGTFGDASRPSGVRVYVGGNGDITYGGLQPFNANLYAPHSHLTSAGAMDVRGALFVGSVAVGGALSVHYDREIKTPAEDDCPDEYVPECTDACDPLCGTSACIEGACAPCGKNSDCCGSLVCLADGSCVAMLE